MPRPKISILRKHILDEAGHYRYYSMNSDPQTGIKRKSTVFNLEPKTEYDSKGDPYPILNVQTEKQLLLFIYQNYGPGEYRVLAFLKGRRGTYTFWKGMVSDEGYKFYEKNYDQTMINILKRDLDEAEASQDVEEIERIKDDLDLEKDNAKKDVKDTRYGFTPHLRRSGKRGEFHSWGDEDEGLINIQNNNVYQGSEQEDEIYG